MVELHNRDGQREPGLGSSGPRVLVVDDHALSRRYTAAALRQTGITVKATGTPQAALEIALRWLPDAICTDLNLPGMGSQEMIRRIREGWPAARPHPLIVLLTADPAPLSLSAPEQARVDRILLKPAAPAQLRRVSIRPADRGMEGAAGSQAPPASLELQRMFRQELAARLPDLERRLARGELGPVRAMLHQLLASSRMCGERRLEVDLQALRAACRDDAVAAEIARRYYTLVIDAGHYLGSL
jgi:CheY-like chemotaxis protein